MKGVIIECGRDYELFCWKWNEKFFEWGHPPQGWCLLCDDTEYFEEAFSETELYFINHYILKLFLCIFFKLVYVLVMWIYHTATV